MFHQTIHVKGEDVKDLAAVAVGHETIYCFGGDRALPMEVHVLNTASLRWKKLTPSVTPGSGDRHLEAPPLSRREHTAVLIEGTAYI